MSEEGREGCQIPSLRGISEGPAKAGPRALRFRFKRALAKPWNYQLKKRLKALWKYWNNGRQHNRHGFSGPAAPSDALRLQAGDWVRVKSVEEIRATLDPFRELKGCAFLEEMWEYCGTVQRVLKPLERFLDERDYKVKKCRGIVLLERIVCRGTPVFGRCDRCCFLFWREEWLEKLDPDKLSSAAG